MCAAVTVELDRYGCCGDNADDGIIHCRTGICLEPNFVMCAAVSSTGAKSPLHSTINGGHDGNGNITLDKIIVTIDVVATLNG